MLTMEKSFVPEFCKSGKKGVFRGEVQNLGKGEESV